MEVGISIIVSWQGRRSIIKLHWILRLVIHASCTWSPFTVTVPYYLHNPCNCLERERERETTVPLCAVILFMEYRGPGTDWEISTLLYDMPIGRRFCRSRLMR